MASNDSSVDVKRKQAHRLALAALTKVYKFEYKIFLVQVRQETPNRAHAEIARVARSRLMDKFHASFDKLFSEEKEKLGIKTRRQRDYEAFAHVAVFLYNDGKGPPIKEIAERLEVSYAFVQKTIRNAGVNPPLGRRRKE